MTIDERLEALTRNLELVVLETEKHDRQIGALASESEKRDRQIGALAGESEKRDRQIGALAGESEKRDRQIGVLVEQSAGQDGRLVRVGERLDALTQSLQLLALETEKHDQQLRQTTILVTEVAEGTARLLRVVEMHEHRIDSHDDRLDKLE